MTKLSGKTRKAKAGLIIAAVRHGARVKWRESTSPAAARGKPRAGRIGREREKKEKEKIS